ncbi:Polyketide cyclase / dehydrase and lipid transport [Andreprevotia lacus DSM 23236]|jgi:hypothetical protein|uniref:Polyketide cyclase / dehydrase and lipid transport n=1 Tax=Andreprevotia lacus DSM 23236 TaxID=1121001 RepID=A0A1W1XXL6_9NEIS|nr:SRPBCC family protein [Andreprevotia lacus]SMC28605.1 Polyketide cyclase / dehydrase and lipid transport [Andreprevotia lacus DSM 23236]
MLIYFVVALLVVLAVLLLLAAGKPDQFRIVRRTHINAEPAQVHALINDFRRWTLWSPWEKKDPAMRRSYGDITAGVGAHYGWAGNKNIGEGSMTIQASTPERIVIQLDFLKPFEAHNIAEFTLTAAGGGTDIEWAMSGPSPLMARVMQLFFSMEKMVGPDFEAGLVNLKAQAERAAGPQGVAQ